MNEERRSLAFVTQWFAPEPVTVPVWIPQALSRLGWDVDVVTGIPNFPSGRVMDGYKPWRRYRERFDDFDVVRTPLYASHDTSAVRRLANYASWAMSSSALAGRTLRSADVALVYSSPATAALPAMLARSRTPYVLMIQDVWPDSIFASGFLRSTGMRSRAEKVVGRFTDAAYRHAHGIAVISPGMKDLLVSRGVPAHKIQVVYNWVDESIFTPVAPETGFRESLGVQEDDFLVMYAGTHGAAQDLGTLVEAFRLLAAHDNIHVALVGEGIAKASLQAAAQREGLDRVHFLAPRPMQQMPGVVAAADAQLVCLADEPLFHITMPSKVQSVMCAGRPVLVSAPGDAARVVTEAGAGMAVPPGSPSLLAEAVQKLAVAADGELAEMAHRGRAAYLRDMSEAVGAGRLSGMLHEARRAGARS